MRWKCWRPTRKPTWKQNRTSNASELGEWTFWLFSHLSSIFDAGDSLSGVNIM